MLQDRQVHIQRNVVAGLFPKAKFRGTEHNKVYIFIADSSVLYITCNQVHVLLFTVIVNSHTHREHFLCTNHSCVIFWQAFILTICNLKDALS